MTTFYWINLVARQTTTIKRKLANLRLTACVYYHIFACSDHQASPFLFLIGFLKKRRQAHKTATSTGRWLTFE